MTATRQVYTLPSNWNQTTLAALFRTMFIDAGLMSDWYDSWTDAPNGLEHRVLRLVNDAGKTYGCQYVWFAFDASDSYIQFATAWDSDSHRPGGALKLDRGPNVEPPDGSDFNCWLWPNSGQANDFVCTVGANGVTVITGTSGDDIGYPLVIFPRIGDAVPPWLDLDRASAFSVFVISDYGNQNAANRYITFTYPYNLGRNLFYGKAGYYSAQYSYDFNCGLAGATYAVMGPGNSNSWGSYTTAYEGAIQIPAARHVENPAFDTDFAPIVTGIQPFPPLPMSMGSDFGFCQVMGTPPAFGDTITVSTDEVWTVIFSDVYSSEDQLCLLARTT